MRSPWWVRVPGRGVEQRPLSPALQGELMYGEGVDTGMAFMTVRSHLRGLPVTSLELEPDDRVVNVRVMARGCFDLRWNSEGFAFIMSCAFLVSHFPLRMVAYWISKLAFRGMSAELKLRRAGSRAAGLRLVRRGGRGNLVADGSWSHSALRVGRLFARGACGRLLRLAAAISSESSKCG